VWNSVLKVGEMNLEQSRRGTRFWTVVVTLVALCAKTRVTRQFGEWALKRVKVLLLPLALQPTVGFGLSNNTSPFFPICHRLCPSSHSQHLKISFYFFSPSFPGYSSLSLRFQFLSKDLFGHPILLHSLQVTQPNYPLPFIHFIIFSPLLNSSSSRFILLFHSPFSYLGPYILLNIFLSKISRACSSFFLVVHVSAPYVTTGLISVVYSRIKQLMLLCFNVFLIEIWAEVHGKKLYI